MLILITRPSHDVLTHYCFHWSKEIIDEAERKGHTVIDLTKDKATKNKVASYLAKQPIGVAIFNGHGNATSICGHKNEVIICSNDDLSIIKGKNIFVRACNCGATLGLDMMVTKPFSFEGSQRARIAEDTISESEYNLHSIITFLNDRIVDLATGRVKFKSALSLVDKVVAEGIKSIADLIITPGIVNIDFSDIKTILGNTGHTLMGIGEASGSDRAAQAARNVLNSPLLTFPIDGATGILFNVAGGENLSLMEIKEAADVIVESVDKDAKIIFGAVRDDSLGNKIKITLIATGLGRTRGVNYRASVDARSKNNFLPESEPPNVQTESKNLPEDTGSDSVIEEFFKESLSKYSKEDERRFEIPAFIRRKMKEL